MKRFLRILSVVMVFCMVGNMLPAEWLGQHFLQLKAQAQAEKAVTVDGFEELLPLALDITKSGGGKTFGEWEYVAFDIQNYAVITGYLGVETNVSVPDQINGLDVVGIADGSFFSRRIAKITIPGNVFAMGSNALPFGTAVRGYNASYAQSWAKKYGHAFENASRLKFCNGVIDFTGIRPENFVRVSANEVWLRTLEAKRLTVGKCFFLADESNLYQVSYYQVKSMDPSGEMIKVYCETPDIDHVFKEISATNEIMRADLSTLKLEKGASLQDANRFGKGSAAASLPINFEIANAELGSFSFYVNASVTHQFKISYDIALFNSKNIKITETKTGSVSAGIKTERSPIHTGKNGNAETYTGMSSEDYLAMTKNALQVVMQGLDELKQGKKAPKVYRQKTCSVTLFSLYGTVNIIADLYFEIEVSGKAEVSFSISSEVVYTYNNGVIDKKALDIKPPAPKYTVEGEIKAGFVLALDLYLACVKLCSIEAFVGLSLKANLLNYAILSASFRSQDNPDLLKYINWNMVDCLEVKPSFVIDVTIKVGLGDHVAFAPKYNLLTVPFGEGHIHLFAFAWPVLKFDSGTGEWVATDEKKEAFHSVDDCPYNTQSFDFVVPGNRFFLDYLPLKSSVLATVDNMLIGETLTEPKGIRERIRDLYNLKFISWHTSEFFESGSEINFPYTVEGKSLTFYAKTKPYHKIHFINVAGKQMENLDADLTIDNEKKTLSEKEYYAAVDEIITLPLQDDKGRTITKWFQVSDPQNLHQIDELSPGSDWKVPTSKEEKDYLMALTDQDVTGRFIYAGREHIVYCSLNGILQAPIVQGYSGQRLKEWVLQDESLEIIQPGGEFHTAGKGKEFTFIAVTEADPNYTPSYPDQQICGSPDGYQPNMDITDTSIDDLLTFNGGVITGVKSGVKLEVLSIPDKREDGTPITAIANSAFRRNKDLTVVLIPSTITSVGTYAFAECEKLQYIFADGLFVNEEESNRRIPDYFAYGCSQLLGVKLAGNLHAIGNYAFAGCPLLSGARLNCLVGNNTFDGDIGLSSLELGDGCTEIYSYAFHGCTNLTNIELPCTMTFLGDYFISECTGLETITVNGRFEALTANKLYIGTNSSLEEIIICEGIKTLGERVFANGPIGFANLKSVTIPASVKNIGANAFAKAGIEELTLYLPYARSSNENGIAGSAFAGMPNLRKVSVMSGRIPVSAFSGNSALEEAVIGANVSAIDDSAFSGCTGLTSVTLEEGIRSIGKYVFNGCTGLTSLVFPDSVTSYGAGMIAGCVNISHLKIGGGVPILQAGTASSGISNPFYIGTGSKLRTLVLGEGITNLKSKVFGNVKSSYYMVIPECFEELTTVELPSTLTEIGSNAFIGSALKELVLYGGTASASEAFRNLTSLEKVTIKDGAIGADAFSGCTGLTSITLGEGVTAIRDGAFSGCTGLTSFEIPDSVTTYGCGMFAGCTNITYLKIGGGVSALTIQSSNSSITNPFFIGEGSRLKTLVLGEGIKSIANYMFANGPYHDSMYLKSFNELTTVELPSTLEKIGEYAFKGSDIQELVLNYGIISSKNAFNGLTSLKNVTIKGGAIGESAFSGCTGLTSVILEEGVTAIGNEAFSGCTGLTSFEIPDSVTTYGRGILSGCTNITDLKIGGGVSALTIASSNSVTTNPFYIGEGSRLKTLVLGEGIKSIANYMFANGPYHDGMYLKSFKELTTVELPSTLETIGENAFKGSDIQELALSNGTASNKNIFSGLTGLKKVTIKGGAIGENAFSGCTGLTSVILEEGVTAIRNGAFSGCTGLSSFEIPDSVTTYGHGMLSGCMNISYLKIGGGVSALTIASSNSVTTNPFYIGEGSRLKTLVLGEGIKSIANYMFANGPYHDGMYLKSFKELTTVELPSTLENIGEYAFKGSNIQELVLYQGAASNKNAFNGLTSLKKVTIKGGAIGANAFSGCTGLTSVILEEGVTSIGNQAFSGCTGLRYFEIPDSVTSYGRGMLEGCTNITYMKIGGGVSVLTAGTSNSVTTNPFYIGEGSKLKTLVLGEGIISIGTSVFANGPYQSTGYKLMYFTELEHVVLPSSLQTISNINLSTWSNVKNLYLPDGLTSLTDSSISSGMTLYSDSFNNVIQNFAAPKGLTYIYGNKNNFPSYKLTCVAPAAGITTRGLNISDGSIVVTRGTEGEETLLPEGFATLSEENVIFTDPVDIQEPAVMEGYAFYGWYTDPEFAMPWIMDTMPGADVTLYARIIPLVHVRYAVNLASIGMPDINLPSGFTLYQDYTVREYTVMPIPADPAPAGYTFNGWYLDSAFVQDYMPPRVGTDDITIYGSLTKASSGATFKLVNGSYTLTGYKLMEDEVTEIHIPAQWNGIPVTGIGAYAFRNSGVKSVYLPDTVTKIDVNAFEDSTVYSIVISKNNPNYSSTGGALYNKTGSMLITSPPGRVLTTFIIPSGVRIIAEKAFANNHNLISVTFNDGLESIEASAFKNCDKLSSVTLPDTVTNLGANAFAGCYSLTTFTAYGLTEIGENAIPTGSGMKGFGPVGDNPLRRCFIYDTSDHLGQAYGYNEYLVNLYVDGILMETIGGEAGTLLTSELKNAVLPDGALILAWYRDSGFSTVWDVDSDLMPASSLSLYASRTSAYDYETVTLTINEIEITGIKLISYNGTAADLVIPATYAGYDVIALGSTFLNNKHPISVTIPSSVLSIEDDALGASFDGTVICDADSYAASWAEENEYGLDVYQYMLTVILDENHTDSYLLAKGVWQILPEMNRAGYSFLGWYTDENLTIQTELTDGCWQMTGVDTTLYAGWEETTDIPFTWIEEDNEIIVTGYTGTADTVTIPNAIDDVPVVAIADGAFTGLDICSIDLGSIITIGESALADCVQLSQIILPDSVTFLGDYAFSGCTALKSLHIGTGLSDFPLNVVQSCERLNSITVSSENSYYMAENGVLFSTDKKKLILYPCHKADIEFSIPADNTEIGESAFNGARELQIINVPDSVTTIGKNAFRGCYGLKTFSASNIQTIEDGAFFGCTSLTTVHPGEQLISIGNFAFTACPLLKEIAIPAATTLNPESMIFSNTDNLIIVGTIGSPVYAYALANGIAFSDPNAVGVEAISITGETEVLQRGDTMQLTVSLTPENATQGMDYIWYTSDSNVAFVDDEDVLHAIGGGSAILTARTNNGIEGTYEIEVQVAVREIVLKEIAPMAVGTAAESEITILPASATDQTITWVSDDAGIVMVDEEGKITAVSAGETAVHAIAHNGIVATLPLQVYLPIESLTLKAPNALFALNGYETGIIQATWLPEEATDKLLMFTSSNSAILTVDETGLLTAVEPGSATVTVTGGTVYGENITRTIEVTVYALENVMILPEMLTMIDEEAFSGNSSVEGVILGSRVTTISNRAFADMSNLRMIDIPDNVLNIEEDVFDNSPVILICSEGSSAQQWAEAHNKPWVEK